MPYSTSLQQKVYYHSPPILKNWLSSLYGRKKKKLRHGLFYHNHLQFLKESQWYDNKKLFEFQFNKLKSFLIHAQQTSNYYNNLFNNIEFNPRALSDFTDINKLPLLSKQTVRENFSEIISNDINKRDIMWSHTSGSTGQSLKFPLSMECFQREYAFRTLHYEWGGVEFGDKIAVCSGHPVTYFNRKKPPFWSYDYSNNWLILSSSHLTERNIHFYLKEIERFQPVILKGYPSSLYLLALANLQFEHNIKPKAVYAASETLFDYQRKTIEEAFKCKVYMWYGTGEMTGNIVECEYRNNHLKLEHSYIEILTKDYSPAKPNEEGRLICTSFGNDALPFIRYDIGDIAIPSKNLSCDCGRGGILIDRVVGRTEDYILTPDGRFVGRMDHLFKLSSTVLNAQIIQKTVEEIIIRMVVSKFYSSKEEKEILKEARNRIGNSINIKVEIVDNIPRTKNGKYRFIISKINKKQFYEQFL